MTTLRSLAVKVSGFVVRHAAEGSREWAEGLAREVEYIDSDWRAFTWAVGSTRVLLEPRRVRATSGQAIQYKSPRMIDIARWMWCFVWELQSVRDILHARSSWDRMSGYLFGLAVAYFAATSIADWRRERWEPSILDAEAYWLFGRKELELKLARSRTARRWFPMLAVVSGVTGWVMHIEGGMHVRHVSSAFWIAIGVHAIWVQLSETPAVILEKIARIDERKAEAIQRIAKMQQPEKRARSEHWGRTQVSKPESHAATIQSQTERVDDLIAKDGTGARV